MSRWQKACGNAFNLAVFMRLTQSARSVLGHKRISALPPKADIASPGMSALCQ